VENCFFSFIYEFILKALVVLRGHTSKRVVKSFFNLLLIYAIIFFHLIEVVEKRIVSKFFHGFRGDLEVFAFDEFGGLLRFNL
jgi:hypothetical protein